MLLQSNRATYFIKGLQAHWLGIVTFASLEFKSARPNACRNHPKMVKGDSLRCIILGLVARFDIVQ
jgi:hypothetical protein